MYRITVASLSAHSTRWGRRRFDRVAPPDGPTPQSSGAAPYGDGNYSKRRGELAIPPPGDPDGLNKLDGLFGLHPSLAGVFTEYQKKQALIVHAIASPYRDRSHFDGQDVLESGAAQTGSLRDGWLNRALLPLGGSLGNEVAIAMAQNTPLVLRGQNHATSWAPSQMPDADDSTLQRLQDMYAGDEFFATRLAQALRSQEIADDQAAMGRMRSRGSDAQQLRTMMQATVRFLTTADGPGSAKQTCTRTATSGQRPTCAACSKACCPGTCLCRIHCSMAQYSPTA